MKMKKYYHHCCLMLAIVSLVSTAFCGSDPNFTQEPPGGLKPEQCPMFVCFGFDDNGFADGVKWFTDLAKNIKNPAGSGNQKTFDNQPVHATFFITAGYGGDLLIKAGGQTVDDVLNSWKGAVSGGHEIANHTYSHPHGASMSVDEWKKEMTQSTAFLKEKLGLAEGAIKGFRTPFLEIGTNTYQALKELNFLYDCSIEAGYGSGWNGDGTDGMWWWGMGDAKTRKKLFWPYQLDNGPAPGVAEVVKPKISGLKLNGLWEMTVYTYLKPGGGEITGFDYNMWIQSSADEFYAILKHNFDLQHEGNRCPITINTHTDYYSLYNDVEFGKSTAAQRRTAIEKFLQYVLTFKDVRVVSFAEALAWTKEPTPLGPTTLQKSNGSAVAPLTLSASAHDRGITVFLPPHGQYDLALVAPNGKIVAARRGVTVHGSYRMVTMPLSPGCYLLQAAKSGTHAGWIGTKVVMQ